MPKNTKIQGNFLIGVAHAFLSLNAVTEIDLNDYIVNINPNGWYPLIDLLTVFKSLKAKKNHPKLLYEAGVHFIQSWFENGGSDLNLGSIGHLKLQDNSQGVKMVFKEYSPEKLYSKLLDLNLEEGSALIEVSDFLPKEFTYGVFYNGVYMWGDFLWMDMETTVIEETSEYTKSLIKYKFKLRDESYKKNYIDELIDKLSVEDDMIINNALLMELAWKLKGLKKELEHEKMLNIETNKILGKALEKQVHVSKALKEANKKIKSQTYTDFLTGLHNKRYFDEQFLKLWIKALKSKEALAIMMIDIDYFKVYNDTYGHVKGDQTLKQVGECIKRSVKNKGSFVARFGGEEYVVVLPSADRNLINKIVSGIFQEIKREYIKIQTEISDRITVSIGTSLRIPTDSTNPETLLSKADTALYRAKSMGRNRHEHEM